MAFITGTQIRMARAALRWRLLDLADASGISKATAQRLELDDDKPACTPATLQAVQDAFEEAGMTFKPQGWHKGPTATAPGPARRKDAQGK